MPDAALINLCNDTLASKVQTDRLADGSFDHPTIEPIAARVRLGLDRIATMSVAGVAGIKAKARLGQNERNARILQISGQNGNRPGQLLN